MSETAGHSEFVPVTFATSREEAERLLALLERHHVPGLTENEADGELLRGLGRGVPVLVPEQMHELATEIIAQDDEDMDEDDDLFEDDDDLDDDDLDDLDDLDDDYDEEEDDDFDPDVDEDEELA